MDEQEFWNEKVKKKDFLYGKEPNEFLVSCINNFSKKERILFLGEGEGRNAVYFAKKGYEVRALDASDVGLSKLQDFAKEEHVEIKTTCLDLEKWRPNKKFGGILASFVHLESPLREQVFKNIEKGLKSGGFFVGEFFSKKQLNYSSGGPKDENLLYGLDSFKGLFKSSIIHKLLEVEVELNEGNGHKGKASVIRLIVQKI